MIFVIFTHWGPWQINSMPAATFFLKHIMPDGNFGVDLFFVLSGFLITRILLNASEQANANNIQIIKAFYIRRALRIFPIYYLLVLIMYLQNDSVVHEHLTYFLTYTTNFLWFQQQAWFSLLHTWSLSVEEQFYLVWPWVILFVPRKYLITVCLLAGTIGLTISVALYPTYGDLIKILPSSALPAFIIGALYAYCSQTTKMQHVIKRTFLWLLPIAVVLYFADKTLQRLSFIRTVNAIIAINLIIYVIRERYNVLTRAILNNNALAYMGKMSYGIYLYHYVAPGFYQSGLLWLSKECGWSQYLFHKLSYPPIGYLLQLAVVLFISWVSYNFFEKQITNFKSRFSYVYKTTPTVAHG